MDAFEKLTDVCGDLVRRRVESEMACLEDVNLRLGYIPAISFRFRNLKRRIKLAPEHESFWLLLTEPSLLSWVRGNVGSIVIEEIALNGGLIRLVQKAYSAAQRSGS